MLTTIHLAVREKARTQSNRAHLNNLFKRWPTLLCYMHKIYVQDYLQYANHLGWPQAMVRDTFHGSFRSDNPAA
jgi:hypothetical protein